MCVSLYLWLYFFAFEDSLSSQIRDCALNILIGKKLVLPVAQPGAYPELDFGGGTSDSFYCLFQVRYIMIYNIAPFGRGYNPRSPRSALC